MFARIDINRDGFITMAEAQALRGQARGPRMKRAERRMDPARRAQAFERLDANRDNVISRDEWARAQEARSQRMAQRGQGAGMQRMRGQGRMGGGMMLRMADADRDQRVSLQEATNAALQRFDRVDLNRDGQITREERQQARQQWQAQRRS
jgi:Ca2+-binding EF-hand superfamily protein